MEKIKKNKKNHPQLITYDTMTQTKVRYRGKRQIEKKKEYHFQLHVHVIPNIRVKMQECKRLLQVSQYYSI